MRFLLLPLAILSLSTPPRFSVENMDRAADPKTDFARYAFGNWKEKNPIPADKSRWGGFDELRQYNWDALKGILESTAAAKNKPGSIEQKVGDLYASALATNAIEKAGLDPIQDDLKKIDSIKDLKDLAKVVAYLHDRGIPALFSVSVSPDQKKSDTYALHASQGGLSLPSKDYYFNDRFSNIRTSFVDHIDKTFSRAGSDVFWMNESQPKKLLEMETQLAESAKTPVELRDTLANYNKIPTGNLVDILKPFPFDLYLKERKITGPAAKEIIVGQPNFFIGLQKQLASQSLSDWQHYLRFQLLRDSAPHLHAALEAENFRFYGTILQGTPEMEPRWQRAARTVDSSIGEALGQLYVAKYYPPEARARMAELIANLQAVMRDRLKSLPWMTEATRQKALAKFDRFTPYIGHPEKWRDYSKVQIKRDNYFANVRNATQFEVKRRLARLGKPVDKGEWSMTPPTVNAYFRPTANQIVFPAGILQPPFFDFTLDDAINYGAIGAVIGHEITHGFDDQGRRYDGEGNLSEWWTDKDAKDFEARAKTLSNQYAGYEVLPGLHLNGDLTLGENIADLGGVSIAYEAHQRSLKGKERKNIDGFTPEQRFFLSWAQQWRTHYRDDAMRRQVTTGPHSPGDVRAFAPLVNMQEFFDAFGIKPGDKMWRDEKDRAKIW